MSYVFGKNTVGATIATSFAGYKMACRYNLPQQAIINSITIYFASSGFNARVGIYTSPGGVLLVESAVEPILAVGWHTFYVSAVTLTAGDYGLAWKTSTDIQVSFDAGELQQTARNLEVFNGFSPSFGTVSPTDFFDVATSIYVAAILEKRCAIATATYGSPLAPQLYKLRRFRDQCLPKPVTSLYYALSPPIAKKIVEHPKLKWLTRKLLNIVLK